MDNMDFIAIALAVIGVAVLINAATRDNQRIKDLEQAIEDLSTPVVKETPVKVTRKKK